MPLDKQVVGIDFTQGIETREDVRLVPQGKMLALNNLALSEANAFTRRDGFALYATTATAQTGLATFNSELLTTTAGGTLSTLASGNATTYSRGTVSPLTLKKQSVRRMIGYQTQPDCATSGTYTAYIWREYAADQTTVLGIYCTVLDEATGAAIIDAQQLSSSVTAQAPRIVYVATTTNASDAPAFIFGWTDGTALAIGAIPTSTFVVLAAANKITTINSGTVSDAMASHGNALFVWGDSNVTNSVYCQHFKYAAGAVSANGSALVITTQAIVPVGVISSFCLAQFVAADTVAVGVMAVTGGAYSGTWTATLTTAASTLLLAAALANKDATAAAAGASHLTATAEGAGVTFFSDQAASFDSGGAGGAVVPIRSLTISAANATTTAVATVVNSNTTSSPAPNGPFIAGKAFTVAGVPYLPVYIGGVLAATAAAPVVNMQSTWFLYAAGSQRVVTVAKALYGGFGLWSINNTIPDSKSIPSTPFTSAGVSVVVPVGEKGELAFAGGQQITPVGLSRLVLSFNQAGSPPISTQIGQNTFHAGGILTAYDGRNVTEAGFHTFPEGISAVDGAGGSVDAGSHQYVACYEWLDSAGQRHQSAPSPAFTYVAPGAKKATVTIPTLRMTAKTGVNLVVFRTVATGTTFYRVNQQNDPIANSASAATVTYTDNVTDANLVAGELLYTTGGTLQNNGPPACSVLCVHQNRLVLGGLEDGSAFQYSQPQVNGFGLQWNETLSGRIAGSGGDIRALESMDEKLFLFGERKPFVMGGQGPSATGAQNGYSQPDEIVSDVGCNEPRSVLKMPMGIIFKASTVPPLGTAIDSKGWYLLTRGHQVQFIGAAVQSYNNNTITAAVLLQDRREVRFYQYSSGGGTPILAWSYASPGTPDSPGQWSTFNNASDTTIAMDALWWPTTGRVVFISSNGRIYQDTPGVFLDDTDPIIGTIDTGWLKPGQSLHAFQRVYKLLLEGAYSASSRLVLGVYYDFIETAAYTTTISTTTTLASGGSWDAEWQLPRQKCQAIRFRITDTPLSGTYAGVDFSSMSLEIGLKRGTVKLPAANRT